MIAAVAVIMEEPDTEQEQISRRHINRILLRLANEPAFADAVIAIMANGGRGKIELVYSNGGRLESVDSTVRKQARG